MAEQDVKMVIEVNLQCRRCYNKIKKILCEIPEIKDPIFDEKQNTVTVTVVSCSPEKVRQKICCKGRDIICCIKIIPPPKPVTKDTCTQTEDPETKDKCTQTTETCPGKQCPPPLVLGYPPGYAMGWGYVCPPCHNRGCSWFCPCNCHCGRPPMCDDGFGRPPMCRDGCGRPAHECRCQRPSYSRCCDRCNNDGNASLSWTLHSCDCGRPPVCTDAGNCHCGRPPKCDDGFGRPPMCHDGCGRPAHKCGCQKPSYSWCCDRCNNDGNAFSSCSLDSCDCGRPPVCTDAGYECETFWSLV